MTSIIVGVVAVAAGLVGGYFARQVIASRKEDSAEAKANKILLEAKTKQKEMVLDAQSKSLEVTEKSKKDIEDRSKHLLELEERVAKREENMDHKFEQLDKKRNSINFESKKVREIRKELEGVKEKQLKTLEKVAGLSREKAKEVLLDMTEKEMKEELAEKIKKLEKVEKEEMDKKARDILSLAIQRCAVDLTSESTATTVTIPSDEMKGRIIGREGRNIRALEQLTGVEIVVDDTPEAIVISGFSPIRRHIAKKALEKLTQDGRIHPGRIEETVESAKKEVAEDIKEAGEAVVYDLGIADLDPKLVQLLGRLKYRTSYGQNVLKHFLEVAHLSAIIAEELGCDVKLAKKAGLLHDIGKAVDHEVEGTHVEIGINILKKFGVSEDVIDAMKSHHEDYPYESTEAVIIQTADAISASRPGARRDSYENYIKRLEDLENIATSFEGVERSYAVQAGREIRVFITPDDIDDLGALKLSRKIADRIEEELKYPGEIKVNVIRETRAVEYAR